ncbi:MAG: hypothetical protein II523_00765 [Bacteroidales bacterium]|nr:hypothetical protein [Bacteroidales bacterium]
MQRESCKNIECRVARIATDHGRKTGCLLKLYRNGVELPTARQIWIDFVVTNDETTPYIVKSCTEINGTAYDVTITDTKGMVFYDGWKRRMRQTDYARKHNLEVPADTIAIEKYHDLMREAAETFKQHQPTTKSTVSIISQTGREQAWRFIKNHPGWYDQNKSYTDEELRDILNEMRDLCR